MTSLVLPLVENATMQSSLSTSPQIAVGGLAGMDVRGRRAGRAERGGELVGDVARLAHAGGQYLAVAGRHRSHRLLELGGHVHRGDGGRFAGQDFLHSLLDIHGDVIAAFARCGKSVAGSPSGGYRLGMRIVLDTPADFDFGGAVCSHGFFVLAPNAWEPANRTLHTVITLSDDLAAAVAIRESGPRRLLVTSPTKLTTRDAATIRAAVRRMLRLDEDFSGFHTLCRSSTSHSTAVDNRFGRLLRSATLFEDIVKVICTCNVAWRQTVAMIAKLVEQWGVPAGDGGGRGFPTPARLATAGPAELKRVARVGYRADYLHTLAVDVVEGRLDLAAIERFDGPTEELCRTLRRIRGVGDYAAGNLCMLLGRYDRLAVDTEMLRLLKARHPRRRFTPASLRRYYAAWQPYQFLAYWFELWQDYVARHGDSSSWSTQSEGPRITSG